MPSSNLQILHSVVGRFSNVFGEQQFCGLNWSGDRGRSGNSFPLPDHEYEHEHEQRGLQEQRELQEENVPRLYEKR